MREINNIQIKNNIRKFREEKGITQDEVAIAIGVTRAYLSKLENQRCSPGPVLKLKLCAFFGVSFKGMFYLEEEG